MKRVFISFDFDNDEELRNALVGQAKNPDSPFAIANYSVKEPMTGDWREKVRRRIRMTDLTIVMCGRHTHMAKGVAAELTIVREESRPYFLLWGRQHGTCHPPVTALKTDKIYKWTWNNLKSLINGAR